MSLYRKIEKRMWGDEKFRRLTPMQPSGQCLWFWLLSGPFTGLIPGLFTAGRAAMAEALRWTQVDFDRCFAELKAAGMVQADWEARLIWLPNALTINMPESPSVVASWRNIIRELPECELLSSAVRDMTDLLTDLGPAWILALNSGVKARVISDRIRGPLAKEARARDGEHCRFCGIQVDWHDRRSDKGGTCSRIDPKGVNTIENIVVSCRGCEHKKGDQTLEEAGMELLTPGSEASQITAQKTSEPFKSSGSRKQETVTGTLKDSCSEPRKARPKPETPPDTSAVIAELPLIDGTQFPVTENMIVVFKPAYPNVDVVVEIAKCRAWLINNPTRRKTKTGIRRALNSWLSRAQDRGAPPPAAGTRGAGAMGAAQDWLERGNGAR